MNGNRYQWQQGTLGRRRHPVRGMGYYQPDYEPKPTDILCAFRSCRRTASNRSRRGGGGG
jgi:hypothetical protein